MAEGLVLPTSDQVPGSNSAGGAIQLMTVRHALHCTESFIITLHSSRYDLKNAERDVKQKLIIIPRKHTPYGSAVNEYPPIQLTLVISTSLISNNRLSRSENLICPWLNMKILQQVKKYCGKEEKLLLRSNFSTFPQYFRYISKFKRTVTYKFAKCGCSNYFFLNSANLICRGTDISKYFRESLGIRDNESRWFGVLRPFQYY